MIMVWCSAFAIVAATAITFVVVVVCRCRCSLDAIICLAHRKKYLINDNDIAQHLFEAMLTKKTFSLASRARTANEDGKETENHCDKLLGSLCWVTALKIFICFALNYRFFFWYSIEKLKPIHFKNEIISSKKLYIQPQVYNFQGIFFRVKIYLLKWC